MLKFAYQRKQDLEAINLAFIDNPKNKYLTEYRGYIEFTLDIKESTCSILQYISVNNEGKILGYLTASLDQTVNSVWSLSVINFYEPSYCFSKDFRAFLTILIHRFAKINFSVVVGNPAEAMYDKVVKKYGGRIVGTKVDEFNIHGTMHNLKMYEILKRDYDAKVNSKPLLCPCAEQ